MRSTDSSGGAQERRIVRVPPTVSPAFRVAWKFSVLAGGNGSNTWDMPEQPTASAVITKTTVTNDPRIGSPHAASIRVHRVPEHCPYR